MNEQNPIPQATLTRIREATERVPDGRMVLFHGSKHGISGPIRPSSRPRCDFGSGFYMGTEPEQALSLICAFENAVFYVLSLETDQIQSFEVPGGLDWALLVAYNRGKMDHLRGSAFYEKYAKMTADCDLLIGNIANDRMYYVMDQFFSGLITDVGLIHSLSVLQLWKQYVAVTERACAAIRIEQEIPLSREEKLAWQLVSAENRGRGVRAANEIVRQFRREGRFFDEILGNVD